MPELQKYQIKKHVHQKYFSKETLISGIYLLIWVYSYQKANEFLYDYYQQEEKNFFWNFVKIEFPCTAILIHLELIFYLILYIKQYPFFEQFKTNNVPWEWNENPKKFKQKLPYMLFIYYRNYAISFIFFYIIHLLFPVKEVNISRNYPSLFENVCWLVWGLFWEDFFYYLTHRILHHPLIYKKIHKFHHENYSPIVISCIYAHWIEFFLGNLLESQVGFYVMSNRMHYISKNIVSAFRFFETHENHSGYSFPINITRVNPFGHDPNFHNYHHLKNNGNFASYFTLWDKLLKTNVIYEKEKEDDLKKIENRKIKQFIQFQY